MVTPAEFEDAQVLLGRPGRSHRTRHVFAYAGMLKCGLCGKTLVPEEHVKPSGKRFVYYRCRGRTDGKPCSNPCLPEAALEKQLEADLRRVTLPPAAVHWITENIRAKLDATIAQQAAQRSAMEKALADSQRESEALLTLRLRGQVDDESFERRRLALLDRQAKLRMQLEQPAPPQDGLIRRLEEVLNFSASLPRAFRDGDPVRRRQIFHAICANPTVRDRKALYKANEPWSFFENAGLLRSWCAVVEKMRTWLLERNFQIPPLFVDFDEKEERRRRAGVVLRPKNRARPDGGIMPRTRLAA
jgi:hypothetical protein